MRAIVQRRYGPPEVLQLEDVEAPAPGAGELLVEVHATTVTKADAAFRQGEPLAARLFSGLWRPRHPVPGLAFSGIVEAVGAGVTRFAPGDRVMGTTMTAGAWAERVRVDQDATIARVPPGLGHGAAIAAGGMHTAWWFLTGPARLRSGQSVLVNGASGGVGSAAVQLAKHLGAVVTGVCSARNVELVRSLGADRVVDYTVQRPEDVDDTFDVVFDAVGRSSFWRFRRRLAPRGRYLTTVPSPGAWLAMLVTSLFGRRRSVLGMAGLHQSVEQLDALLALASDGTVVPYVDRTYPLSAVADAHRYVDSDRKRGQIVITVR